MKNNGSLKKASLVLFEQTLNLNENKDIPQHDRIQEIQKYCIKVQKKGINPSYTVLVDHFDENTISKLIQSGQLNKIPRTDCYQWGDK